jgi:hypothetical protein
MLDNRLLQMLCDERWTGETACKLLGHAAAAAVYIDIALQHHLPVPPCNFRWVHLVMHGHLQVPSNTQALPRYGNPWHTRP